MKNCLSRACSVFRTRRGSEISRVSVITKIITKITARESKKRAMQHSPTVLQRSLWPGGCFSSIKNPARKKSIAGCGRNRGSKIQFWVDLAFTEICRMLVGGNNAIIYPNLVETHGKLGLAPRVNLVALEITLHRILQSGRTRDK